MHSIKKTAINSVPRTWASPTFTTPLLSTASRAASICALVLAVACTPGDDSGSTSSGQLRVAKMYQEHLDKDLQRVEEGRAPSCAHVFGHANVALNIDEKGNADEAMHAIEACYVHLQARYFDKLLDPIRNGDGNCNALLVNSSVNRSAMRMILEGMGVEIAPLDQQLNELIREDIEQWCPETVNVLFG